MFHPNALYIHIAALPMFSADGNIHRAFDHLIAAKSGFVLLVPIHLVQGNFTDVVDGCPVPWEEVDDILTTEPRTVHSFDFSDEDYSKVVLNLSAIAASGWMFDVMNINGNQKATAWRFTHDSGVRCAVAGDLVYQG